MNGRYGRLLLAGLAIALCTRLPAGRVGQEGATPEAVARAFVEAYNAHNVERLVALYDDDIHITTPDLSVLKGKEPHQKYYQAWFKSVPDVQAVIKSIMSEDERFMLELTDIGTYTKTLPTPGAPVARGQKLRYPYVILGRVREGRIVSLRYYENDLLVERQLRIRR